MESSSGFLFALPSTSQPNSASRSEQIPSRRGGNSCSFHQLSLLSGGWGNGGGRGGRDGCCEFIFRRITIPPMLTLQSCSAALAVQWQLPNPLPRPNHVQHPVYGKGTVPQSPNQVQKQRARIQRPSFQANWQPNQWMSRAVCLSGNLPEALRQPAER